jgi:uncharacterized protein YndB with AHSA1/START domain
MTHASYETLDGRPAVRLERHIAHPVEQVWRAVTEPSELAHWFPAQVTIELRPGGSITFAQPVEGKLVETHGEVLELDPPHRLAFTWEDQELSFELDEEDSGCRLVLTHVLADRHTAARDAAGWEVCVDRLARRLDGEDSTAPTSEPTAEWQAYFDEYVRAGFPEGAPIPGR